MNETMRRASAVIALLALSACVNPYRANFNSTQDKLPSWVASRLGPLSMSPKLMKVDDIRKEGWALFERGYVMVGFARFDGPQLDPDLAVAEGKKVGADIVLVQDRYTHSLTETVAMTQWPADETTEVRTQGQVTGERGTHVYDSTTETRTSHGPETVYVPRQTDFYEHAATFWRRIEATLFGAFVSEMSDAQKQALQTNQGLVVRAVMVDSPAYKADLLKGDIIRQMNDQPVPGAAQFYEDLAGLAGKEIHLTVLRGGQTVDKPVRLNP